MTMITDFSQQSELALAAYAQLFSGVSDGLYRKALENAGMSAAQAAEFSKKWTVVNQYTPQQTIPVYDEQGNYIGERPDTTGFSATLFERDGKRYLAIRGTEPSDGQDLIADADLAVGSGVATQQAVSLYNYVQQLKGAKGQPVAQLKRVGGSYVLNSTGAVGLLDAPLSGAIEVTGHSLGGHLAMAMGRLCPQDVSNIYTYNAPGFNDAAEANFFAQVDTALGRAGSQYQDGKTTNLYGSGLNMALGSGLALHCIATI